MEIEWKIKQAIPAINWWSRYKDESMEDDKSSKPFFYVNIPFFVILEDQYGTQDIRPIDFDPYGIWDLDDNRDGLVYSAVDPNFNPNVDIAYRLYVKDKSK